MKTMGSTQRRENVYEPVPGEVMLWNCNKPITLVCCHCGLEHKVVIDLPAMRGFLRVKMYPGFSPRHILGEGHK